MPYKFNPFTSNFDYYETSFKGIFGVAPSNPQEGWFYINSTDNGYYVYYSGSWQLIKTLSSTLSYLLLEDGTHLLLEDGFKLALQ